MLVWEKLYSPFSRQTQISQISCYMLSWFVISYMRRSKHGTDSMVISLGGIAPQGSLSLHTVGAHVLPNTICIQIYIYIYISICICIIYSYIVKNQLPYMIREYIPLHIYIYIYIYIWGLLFIPLRLFPFRNSCASPLRALARPAFQSLLRFWIRFLWAWLHKNTGIKKLTWNQFGKNRM